MKSNLFFSRPNNLRIVYMHHVYIFNISLFIVVDQSRADVVQTAGYSLHRPQIPFIGVHVQKRTLA